uniref:Uncharacterized protein n=1 Tax=Trichogramma kaykai TaxID=54128 RepID=A0ABD2WBF0_9HYME
MFHMHFGISVPYRAWRKVIKSQSSCRFLRALVLHIWPEEEFIRKAVQFDQVRDKTNREPLTPRKTEALKRGYIQYLLHKREMKKVVNTKQEKKIRDQRINKFGRELGIIISHKRTKWFAEYAETKTDEETDTETDSETDSETDPEM